MRIIFSENSWKDYICWQEEDKKRLFAINELIKDILVNPYIGKGKPQKLVGKLSEYWSRRIDKDHRIIYQIVDGEIIIISCRFHYIYE